MECRGGVRGARGVGWEGGEGRMCRGEGDGNKRVRVAGGGREGRGEHLQQQQPRCRRSSRGVKIIIDRPLLSNGVRTCVRGAEGLGGALCADC